MTVSYNYDAPHPLPRETHTFRKHLSSYDRHVQQIIHSMVEHDLRQALMYVIQANVDPSYVDSRAQLYTLEQQPPELVFAGWSPQCESIKHLFGINLERMMTFILHDEKFCHDFHATRMALDIVSTTPMTPNGVAGMDSQSSIIVVPAGTVGRYRSSRAHSRPRTTA